MEFLQSLWAVLTYCGIVIQHLVEVKMLRKYFGDPGHERNMVKVKLRKKIVC
jgi:hypothetical protein